MNLKNNIFLYLGPESPQVQKYVT